MDKRRIVKDYDALPEEVVSQLKLEYPHGFAQNLISFTNKEGKKVSALPFETDEVYYLVRMTTLEAERIIEDDEDYDDEGNLREDFSAEIEEEIVTDSAEEEESSGFDHDDPIRDQVEDEDEEED